MGWSAEWDELEGGGASCGWECSPGRSEEAEEDEEEGVSEGLEVSQEKQEPHR